MQTFSLKKCTFFNLDNTFSPIFGIQNHHFDNAPPFYLHFDMQHKFTIAAGQTLNKRRKTILPPSEKPSGRGCPPKVGGRAKRRGYEKMRKASYI